MNLLKLIICAVWGCNRKQLKTSVWGFEKQSKYLITLSERWCSRCGQKHLDTTMTGGIATKEDLEKYKLEED